MTATTAEPPWVADERRFKAAAIFTALRESGVSADAAAHYDTAQRVAAAVAAGQRRPSPRTWTVVVEMLATSERERALCPFCGIGDPAGEPGPPKPAGHTGRCAR